MYHPCDVVGDSVHLFIAIVASVIYHAVVVGIHGGSLAEERGDGLCVVVVALCAVELVENGCMTLVEHCHIVDVLAYGKLVCRLTDTAEDIFYCISRILAWIIFSLIL